MTGHNQKIGGGGFHHIALRVKDCDASLRFYTDGLGFTPAIAWGEGSQRAVMLDTGDGNYFELFAGGDGLEKPEGMILHVALRTDDCDSTFQRAIAAGARVEMEPKDIDIASEPPLPVRIAFCRGLDGETIEFFQYR